MKRDTDLDFVVTPLGDFTDGVGICANALFFDLRLETAISDRIMEDAVYA